MSNKHSEAIDNLIKQIKEHTKTIDKIVDGSKDNKSTTYTPVETLPLWKDRDKTKDNQS